MKKLSYSLFVLLLIFSFIKTEAQSYTDLYSSIESNNYQLNILRQELVSSSLNNMSSMNLSDPQVGLGYMWGDEITPTDKRTLSVTQEFDLTTVFGVKKRLARSVNSASEALYSVARQKLFEEFSQKAIKWRYLTKQLDKRYVTANLLEQLFDSYQKRLESGELSRLDFNKIQFSIAEFSTQIKLLELERENLFRQLTYLNGGISLDTMLLQYDLRSLPNNFAQWFDSVIVYIPEMHYYLQNKEVSKNSEKLARLSWLPQISAGYQSEISNVEAMRGGALGVSLPLWSNKNKVKSQEAEAKVADLKYEEAMNRLKNEYSMKFDQISVMQNLLSEYLNAMSSFSVLELESKAYQFGAMSALDYLESMIDYISLYDKVLEIEYLIQIEKISFVILENR